MGSIGMPALLRGPGTDVNRHYRQKRGIFLTTKPILVTPGM